MAHLNDYVATMQLTRKSTVSPLVDAIAVDHLEQLMRQRTP
jgi:hypothetical protein